MNAYEEKLELIMEMILDRIHGNIDPRKPILDILREAFPPPGEDSKLTVRKILDYCANPRNEEYAQYLFDTYVCQKQADLVEIIRKGIHDIRDGVDFRPYCKSYFHGYEDYQKDIDGFLDAVMDKEE